MNYSIIYRSIARDSFTKVQIKDMLQEAKFSNRKHSVTGCILYRKKQFIQIIEGPKEAIITLYDKIKADERHYNVQTLIETETSDTLWNDWSMAFYNFDGTANENKHSRILMEAFFDQANTNQKASEIYKVLRTETIQLLNS